MTQCPTRIPTADAAAASLTVEDATGLAQAITRTAHRYAQDPYQRTPWSVASCEQVTAVYSAGCSWLMLLVQCFH